MINKKNTTIRFSLLSREENRLEKTPQREDEESVFGHMPDVESDDSTMDNEHSLGLRLDEDMEHPKPLDTEGDLSRIELYRRTH